MKMLSEVDGRVLSCCMTIEPALDKKERLFGSPWREFAGRSQGRGACRVDRNRVQDREHILPVLFVA